MKSLPPIVVLLALLTLATAARAADPIEHGLALAKEFCAPCHAIGQRGRSRHSDAPPLRNMGRTYDLDDFARVLSRGLASGHPDMPQFHFTYDDARDLTDYLRTIQE